MSRTWLLRGGAVAVFVVLVGAWAVGLAAGFGDGPPTPEKVAVPAEPDDTTVPVIHRSIVVEKAKSRRTRDADPTQEASPEPVDGPTDDDPTTPAPTTPAPTTPSGPSDGPPTTPPGSPHTPRPSDDECDNVVDCALDPVTGRP